MIHRSEEERPNQIPYVLALGITILEGGLQYSGFPVPLFLGRLMLLVGFVLLAWCSWAIGHQRHPVLGIITFVCAILFYGWMAWQSISDHLEERHSKTEPITGVPGTPQETLRHGAQINSMANPGGSREAVPNALAPSADLEQHKAEPVANHGPTPLGAPATKSKIPPIVAVLSGAWNAGSTAVNPALSGALQDALLRHGIEVNVELESEDFVTHNMGPLLGGDGEALRKVKPHLVPKWDYVLVVELSESPAEAATSDMRSFRGTADCRIYSGDGVLLTTRRYSETGTGFSEQQARDASATRLAKTIADYVALTIMPDKAQEETKP